MIEAAYFEDNSHMMTIDTGDGSTTTGMIQQTNKSGPNMNTMGNKLSPKSETASPLNNTNITINNNNNGDEPPQSLATTGHVQNISYVDPIDEALHTSYQWTMPGFSIDHVMYFVSFYIVVVYLFDLFVCVFDWCFLFACFGVFVFALGSEGGTRVQTKRMAFVHVSHAK